MGLRKTEYSAEHNIRGYIVVERLLKICQITMVLVFGEIPPSRKAQKQGDRRSNDFDNL